MCEHLGISTLNGKIVKGDGDSITKENLLFCSHLLTTTTLKLR